MNRVYELDVVLIFIVPFLVDLLRETFIYINTVEYINNGLIRHNITKSFHLSDFILAHFVVPSKSCSGFLKLISHFSCVIAMLLFPVVIFTMFFVIH